MGSGISAPGRIVSLRHGPDDRVVGTLRGPAIPIPLHTGCERISRGGKSTTTAIREESVGSFYPVLFSATLRYFSVNRLNEKRK